MPANFSRSSCYKSPRFVTSFRSCRLARGRADSRHRVPGCPTLNATTGANISRRRHSVKRLCVRYCTLGAESAILWPRKGVPCRRDEARGPAGVSHRLRGLLDSARGPLLRRCGTGQLGGGAVRSLGGAVRSTDGPVRRREGAVHRADGALRGREGPLGSHDDVVRRRCGTVRSVDQALRRDVDLDFLRMRPPGRPRIGRPNGINQSWVH